MIDPTERRHLTIHEFLLSRGVSINMRAPTQAEQLNDRLAAFVYNPPVETWWQKFVNKMKDSSNF